MCPKELMDSYQIKVERDSVCMGDDVDAPHTYSFNLPSNVALQDIFEHLAEKRYLASVAGKNHSWEALVSGKSLAIFKGNKKRPEPSGVLSTKISQYVENGKLYVHFKYNSATT